MKPSPYALLAFFAVLAHVVVAQNPDDLTPAMWSEGSILLNDGTELKGLVRYDDRNSLLSFQSGNDSKSFTPRSVSAFEYFDELFNQRRVFYVFPYEDPIHEAIRPQFFEVLREFKNFTVLCKIDPLEFDAKGNTFTRMNKDMAFRPIHRFNLIQTEIVYIMDLNNEINPYIRTTRKQDGTRSLITGKDTKTKKKMIDESLLEASVTPPIYLKLEQYAKENDLSFKYRDDLLLILDYYGTLATN